MHIIIITNYRRKLMIFAFIAAAWLLLFMLGSFLIDNTLLFNITVDSCVEFSYPYGIVVDNILVSNSYADRNALSTFSTSRPQTGQFINYESLEGKFSFNYPSAFVIKSGIFTGGDILYHIDFHDRQDSAHGFVQVWNLPGELGEFLEKSKETSQQTYKYFKSDNIELNGVKGYIWDYSVLTQNGFYKGSEIFLKQNGRMYRLSYFLPEEQWNDKQSELFWNMAKSFKIKTSS